MPLSVSRAYFDSQVVQNKGKAAEAHQKVVSALFGRLDAVLKGINHLTKAIGALRPRR